MKQLLGRGRDQRRPEATEEFATLSSLTLLPGPAQAAGRRRLGPGNYREHNEDNTTSPAGGRSGTTAIRTASGELVHVTLEPSNLFIVADGMGGQQAGEQASRMAVEIIPRRSPGGWRPRRPSPRRIKEAIRDAVAEANQEILGCSGAVTEFSNMGTTVVLALFRNDRVLRRRDRRLARLPPPRRPARAADQGPLAGRRPARGRHDHRRGAAEPQVQERPVSLPGQQGRPGRARRRPGARRPAGRPVPAGQRRPHRASSPTTTWRASWPRSTTPSRPP